MIDQIGELKCSCGQVYTISKNEKQIFITQIKDIATISLSPIEIQNRVNQLLNKNRIRYDYKSLSMEFLSREDKSIGMFSWWRNKFGHNPSQQVYNKFKEMINITENINKLPIKIQSEKIGKHRNYIRRDWSSLVIEYMGLESKPTISKFLISKGLDGNNQAYFRKYLTRAKSELTRKTKVNFEISELKSSGVKQ